MAQIDMARGRPYLEPRPCFATFFAAAVLRFPFPVMVGDIGGTNLRIALSWAPGEAPAMILKDGRPWVSFGVMGGDNQGQAHAQVVMNLVDFGMNVRDAGDAARVRHMGTNLAVESGVGLEVRKELELRGHRITDGRGAMGGYQAIMIDPKTGLMMGGSDLRKDGLAIGW